MTVSRQGHCGSCCRGCTLLELLRVYFISTATWSSSISNNFWLYLKCERYLKIKFSCKTSTYSPITAKDNGSLVGNKTICVRWWGTFSRLYTFEHMQLYSHIYLKKLLLTMSLVLSNGSFKNELYKSIKIWLHMSFRSFIYTRNTDLNFSK